MIIGLHHVALGVPDFELGLELHRHTLALEVEQRSVFDRDA